MKKKEGKGENYVGQIRGNLGFLKVKGTNEYNVRPGSFADLGKLVNEVSIEDLDRLIWDETWDVSSTTRLGLWKALHHFFEWGAGKVCGDKNPLLQITKPPKNELDPEAFTVEQAERIMRTAAGCYDGELVPYFAIALFAGLRPQEITGNDNMEPLQWDKNFVWEKDDVGKDKVTIRLKGKMAWRRTVLLPENCLAWITPYRKKRGPVCPSNFKKKYDVIRCAAGFQVGKVRIYGVRKKGIEGLDDPQSKDRPEWIIDGCRHSALSYRLAIVEDVQAVCAWAGNSPRTFKAHYEALVTKEQAKKYWAIYP